MERHVKSKCTKCGTTITLDFGDYNFSQALSAIDMMDKMSRECPGFHVEIGGWKRMWNLDTAVLEAYTAEEKSACKEEVREIIVSNTDRQVASCKDWPQFNQFIDGYSNHAKEDATLKVTAINYAGEIIESSELKVYAKLRSFAFKTH
jgi:hypothetical protein